MSIEVLAGFPFDPNLQSEARITQRFDESIKKLASTASWMTSELGVMLFANVLSSMTYMLTYTLMAVVHTGAQEQLWFTGFVWDLTDIFDAFLRMCIIAHSADQLRSIVSYSLVKFLYFKNPYFDINNGFL